ncbi:MAG: hypothetical protein LJE73_05470 [Proteobacteria bacterium]|nr:hypothetical protein [Pseudomonadota bacterium]
MRNINGVLIALVFSLPALANSGWIDKQGNAVPDSDHMKSSKDFIAQLVLTDNEAEALKTGTPHLRASTFPLQIRSKKAKLLLHLLSSVAVPLIRKVIVI